MRAVVRHPNFPNCSLIEMIFSPFCFLIFSFLRVKFRFNSPLILLIKSVAFIIKIYKLLKVEFFLFW